MTNKTWTTVVIMRDGREVDLGAGERVPTDKSKLPKNAFTRPVATKDKDAV